METAAASASPGDASAEDPSDVTPDSSDVTCDLLVIGAGVSGLTAANELLKRDATVRLCVVEAKGQW